MQFVQVEHGLFAIERRDLVASGAHDPATHSQAGKARQVMWLDLGRAVEAVHVGLRRDRGRDIVIPGISHAGARAGERDGGLPGAALADDEDTARRFSDGGGVHLLYATLREPPVQDVPDRGRTLPFGDVGCVLGPEPASALHHVEDVQDLDGGLVQSTGAAVVEMSDRPACRLVGFDRG